jgi:YaeQ protein
MVGHELGPESVPFGIKPLSEGLGKRSARPKRKAFRLTPSVVKSLRRICAIFLLTACLTVVVISYSGRSSDVWWDKIAAGLARSKNLTVVDIPTATVQALASLADRNMQLQCLIQDGQAQLMSAKASVPVESILRMVPDHQDSLGSSWSFNVTSSQSKTTSWK